MARPTSATIDVALEPHGAVVGIDGHLARVAAVGVDVAGGHEIGLGRQPAARPLGERRDLEEPDAPVGAGDGEAPAGVDHVGGCGLEHPGGERPALLHQLPRAGHHGATAHAGGARAVGAGAPDHAVRVPEHDLDAVEGDAQGLRGDLREHGGVAHAEVLRAGADDHPAVPRRLDLGELGRRAAVVLDVHRRSPNPRSAPRAWLAARRAGKPRQSASSSARSRFSAECARSQDGATRRRPREFAGRPRGFAGGARCGRCRSRAPPPRSGSRSDSSPRCGRFPGRRRAASCGRTRRAGPRGRTGCDRARRVSAAGSAPSPRRCDSSNTRRGASRRARAWR